MISTIWNAYKFRKAMAERDKDPRLELAMEVDGHRLYKYRTVDAMPLAREIITRVGYGQLETGMRRDDLIVYGEKMDTLLNEGNHTRAAQLNGFLQEQLREFIPERIALEIGGYSVLVDDEPHEITTPKHNKIKTHLVTHYPQVRDFFIAESVTLVSALNTTIDTSLTLGRLMNPSRAARERIFLRMMGLDMFSGLWTAVTPPPSGWQNRVATILQAKS